MRKPIWFLLLLLLLAPFTAIADLEVLFLEVGDADAALVQCDGHAMLIDGGNKGDSSLIYTVLKQNNITHLDIVVATHSHEDHIGGIPGALNYATADLILCPVTSDSEDAFQDFEKYANTRGNGITVPNVGDTYSLGGAEIAILGVNSASGENNSSIVLKLTYGNTSFLFAGDAESEAESKLVSSGKNLSADVLKVAHHGSNTSSTYAFLQKVKPSIAVISVDIESKYAFPTKDVLQRLEEAGATIYRTDRNGDILCKSDGKNISVTVETVRHIPQDDTQAEEQNKEVAYVANMNTKKFHDSRCRYVETIKEKNKWEYDGTREELIERGYTPCKVCNP